MYTIVPKKAFANADRHKSGRMIFLLCLQMNFEDKEICFPKPVVAAIRPFILQNNQLEKKLERFQPFTLIS
jgi:hypothetical protein